LTELTPGHWFFATPISLAFSEQDWCPSHLLLTVCSRVVMWGQVWTEDAAGPPSAFIAVSPTTFKAPTLHCSTSDLRAVSRFSVVITAFSYHKCYLDAGHREALRPLGPS